MASVLVCLHGWGGSQESFTELREALRENTSGSKLKILTPDLPGFGEEKEPKQPWSVNNYADWTEAWIKKHVPAKTPILLLGHSHGGRIALKLAARRSLPIEHLYLCASAGIRHPRHFKRIFGLTLAKSGKFLLGIPGIRSLAPLGKKFLYRLVRVHDYEKASPIMRETLIKVAGEDLRSLLPKVKIPTDIFWGTDDRMTPVKDGELMHEQIKGSALHIYKGIRHRVHRDRAQEIAKNIRLHL